MTGQGGTPWGIMRSGWTQKIRRKCILEEEMGSLKALRLQGKLLFLVESESDCVYSTVSEADED